MGTAQSTSTVIFPKLNEEELKKIVALIGPNFRYEKTLGRGRLTWSVVCRPKVEGMSPLLLLRLFVKPRAFDSVNMPAPLFEAKLNYLRHVYLEKCAEFDFIGKPLELGEKGGFVYLLRSFSRFTLCDRLIS